MFSNDSDVCTISASVGCTFFCIFTFGMSLTAVLFCGNNSFLTEQQLLSMDNDILGACRFIYPYRENSVKWNPQDNRCSAFEIEVKHNDDGFCRFSGGIYDLS